MRNQASKKGENGTVARALRTSRTNTLRVTAVSFTKAGGGRLYVWHTSSLLSTIIAQLLAIQACAQWSSDDFSTRADDWAMVVPFRPG